MLIRADHKRWAGWLFYPYLGRILRKDFTNFFVVNDIPAIPTDHGLLVTPNHISWWDGFFIDFLMRKMSDRRIHLMMLKEQLARYSFFRFLGAYSIDPGNRKSVLGSLAYTAEILSDPSAFVVMYPQGEIVPQRSTPLNFKQGVLTVLQRVSIPVDVIPIIFLIKPYNERQSEVWCRFGPAVSAKEVGNNLKHYEALCNNQLLRLEESVLRREFRTDLLKGRRLHMRSEEPFGGSPG